MLEEYITRRIEHVHDQMTKLEDDAEQDLATDAEKRKRHVTVSSSYTYQGTESALNTQERFHYEAIIAVSLAMQAVESKLLKSQYSRDLARKFLLSETGKRIRSLLYRKGDKAKGLSEGLLRSSNSHPGVLKALKRHRGIKQQILSTGISIKQAGMTKGGVISEGMEKMLSFSMYMEELSPAKMLRTMSASHVLHSLKMRKDMPLYHITGDDLDKFGSYYEGQVEKYGRGRRMNATDAKLGMFYEDGKIFGAKKDEFGKIIPNRKDIMIHGALPVFTQTDVTNHALDKNVNQIFRKALIEEGVPTSILDNYNRMKGTNKVSFIFGHNDADTARKLTTAYASKMFESGSRALDTPFAKVAEFAEGKIRNMKDPTSKVIAETLYNIFSPRFGSGTLARGGDKLLYDRKLADQAKSLFKNVIVKPLGIAAAVMTADQVIGNVFGDQYRMKQIAGDIVANTQLLYAKVFSDGFLQDIKQKQEEIMPGSTGFQPILGVVGSAAMSGAVASYALGLKEKATLGFELAEKHNAAKELNIKPFSRALGKMFGPNTAVAAETLFTKMKNLPVLGPRLRDTYSRTGRWAIAGAAIGGLLALPLLPGALAGTTSDELSRQFSGEDKVAVRSNSGWMMGGEDIAGGKTKYYDRHWYAKLKQDVHTKVHYGDKDTEDAMNPITHPFSYLADPYQKEKLTEKEMPYPVWGMDVTYGGFIGEAFEASIGRMIKPTVVNQNIEPYLASDNKEGEYRLKKRVTQDEAELIREQKLLSPIAPTNDPSMQAAKKSVIGALDFSGFKGFMAQSAVSETGYTDPLGTNSALEISGSSETLARTIKEANLGDMLGMGEQQRRVINTGADSLAGRKENPIRNTMPSWMPDDRSDYYIDFRHGNPYSKVENADARLPGVGYATFNPTLKGMNPENYPLINRYEILADVALGSKEYYNTKRELDNKSKRGELTPYELKKMETIETQTSDRSSPKKFRDDLSPSDVASRYGMIAGVARGYWDMLSSAAQGPQEALTPVRLGSKFIHDRTDIEDYKKNVLFGNDMALWTRPIDHFSSASAYEALDKLDGETLVPESVERKRAIDQYFDRLEFYKQRQIYKQARDSGDTEAQREAKAKYEGTKIGAEATGLNSKQDLFAAYRSMSGKEKEYFHAFASATDPDKQEEILSAVSDDEARLYKKIWENNEAVGHITSEEEMKNFETDSTQAYEASMEHAEQESVDFMSTTLGMPDVDFSGWDRRIETKDVKLRFLQLSGDQVRDYGYWANDELEMLRKVAILRDINFMDKREEIGTLVSKYTSQAHGEFVTRNNLMQNNVKAKNVEVREGNGSFEFTPEHQRQN